MQPPHTDERDADIPCRLRMPRLLPGRDMKDVYIIGAQSTGKTTLVNALAKDLTGDAIPQRPKVIHEVARTVQIEKGFSREDITTSPVRALQLQKHILEAQYSAQMATCDSVWCILDRSGLDPIVYTKCYVSSEASADLLASRIWLELESRMQAGIVVLCEAGCQWLTDDGVRLMPTNLEEWLNVDTAFRDLLEARDISYAMVPKEITDLEKRVEFVLGLIGLSRTKMLV